MKKSRVKSFLKSCFPKLTGHNIPFPTNTSFDEQWQKIRIPVALLLLAFWCGSSEISAVSLTSDESKVAVNQTPTAKTPGVFQQLFC